MHWSVLKFQSRNKSFQTSKLMAPLLCTLLCYLKVVSKQESGAAIIQTISVPKKHVWWWQMSDFQSNPVVPQRTHLLDICLCEGLTASTSKNTKWQQVDSGRLFWWSIFCWVIEIRDWLCESGLKQTSPKYSLVLMSVCAAISISETAHSKVSTLSTHFKLKLRVKSFCCSIFIVDSNWICWLQNHITGMMPLGPVEKQGSFVVETFSQTSLLPAVLLPANLISHWRKMPTTLSSPSSCRA